MDHIVFKFKEEGIGVNDDNSLKVAESLKNINYNGEILVYVEFNDADTLYAFFKLYKLARLFGDPEKLEETLTKMKKEKEELDKMISEKGANINVEVNVDNMLKPVKLNQLVNGITLGDHEVRMQIADNKIILDIMHKQK